MIDRWRRFVDEVRTPVLPKNGGRLVKSLEDGRLLEFESVTEAVRCALAIQRFNATRDTGLSTERHMSLQVGAHVADLIVGRLRYLRHGVNLAARIASLAAPEEIVASIEVRDQFVEGLDATVDDLGKWRIGNHDRPGTAPDSA